MLAILTSKLGLAGIALALVVAVIGIQTIRLDHAKGDLARLKASDAAALKAAQADVTAHNVKSAAISEKVSSDLSKERTAIEVRYRTLVKRVPVEVGQGALNCSPPASWVAIWNAGAEVQR